MLRSLRFASLVRPGVAGLRADGPAGALGAGPALLAPGGGVDFEQGRHGDVVWAQTRAAGGGGITAAACQRTSGGGRAVERLVAYLADPDQAPPPEAAAERLREAETIGFERLLAEHRAAWAARWADAEVAVHGDPDAELAVRFALFHLLASAAGEGEAAVGARGLTGPVYAGHVFWDADVFVLPVLAAVHPGAARAMLEYRIRRLGPARRLAAAQGRSGARFPLGVGRRRLRGHAAVDDRPAGQPAAGPHRGAGGPRRRRRGLGRLPLRRLDRRRRGPGRPRPGPAAGHRALLGIQGAAGRAGRAHIDGVIGPDEYHVDVDDNAFTNVMARWNLRRAADLAERAGGAAAAEVRGWRRLADALVDGYDPATGRYRQFSGFDDLEPMVIGELARPPVAADLLLGHDRVRAAQVVKQADVLMLHLLVPEETAAGSLVPNLAFYDPRTAHGSSLSPAVHAALLARAGDPDRALELFRLASRLDLHDLTRTTAGGLHVATMGGVWQALTTGFCGLRPTGQALELAPCLPAAWEAVELRLRYHGRRLHLRAGHDRLELATDGPVPVSLAGLPAGTVVPPGATWRRVGTAWNEEPRSSGPR